jgi:hypothetical protein
LFGDFLSASAQRQDTHTGNISGAAVSVKDAIIKIRVLNSYGGHCRNFEPIGTLQL